MNFLDAIRLMQAGPDGLDPGLGEPLDDSVNNPISVVARRAAEPVQTLAPPALPPPRTQDYEIRQAAPDLDNSDMVAERLKVQKKNDGKHSGMFGVKGTLRDVLGTLGDAFLVQSGNKQVYAPQRQLERAGDAMTGFTQAPLGAIERMTGVDPAGAAKLNDDYQQQQAVRAAAQLAAQKAAEARLAQGVKIFGAAASAANPETYERMKPLLAKLKDQYQLGDEFQIPDQYDPDMMGAYGDAAIASDGQARLEQGERRLDQGQARVDETVRNNKVNNELGAGRLAVAQQNADTARKRMEKSGSSGSRPRADTELEYFRSLEKIPASQRSPEQNAWVGKYTGTNKTRGSGRGLSAPASNRSERFRRLN